MKGSDREPMGEVQRIVDEHPPGQARLLQVFYRFHGTENPAPQKNGPGLF